MTNIHYVCITYNTILDYSQAFATHIFFCTVAGLYSFSADSLELSLFVLVITIIMAHNVTKQLFCHCHAISPVYYILILFELILQSTLKICGLCFMGWGLVTGKIPQACL